MCEGSQVNPMFYQGFVEVFFDRGRERRHETPDGGCCRFRRSVRYAFFRGVPRWQEFFDKYCNPLGLPYSLYRGADLYLPTELSVRPSNRAE